MSKDETTIYKGLAILLVILCHAVGCFGDGKVVWFTPFGGIGVSIFLLLSGYGLNASWNLGGGKFVNASSPPLPPFHCWWRKRFLAVWLPYILLQLLAYWPLHPFDFRAFLLDLSCLKPRYHNGWYLQYLILWYAVFYVVRRVRILNDSRLVVFTMISIVFFFILSGLKAEQSLSFLAGILLSEREELQKKLFHARYGLALMLFGIMCLAVKQLPIIRSAPQLAMNAVQLGIKLPVGLGLVFLCHIAIQQKWTKQITGSLGTIGLISYELYLIHGYVLLAVPKNFLGISVFILATAALSIAFWWFLKKSRPVLSSILRIV